MPIKLKVKVKKISEDAFYSLDYKIMKAVFSIHNDLGRFYDEKIYQNELAYRCKKMGIEEVATEVPIQVSYKNFVKFYYMDVLINNEVMYELKAVKAINEEHRKQAINYLLLTGLQHGKLINMRPRSVQHNFVSTKLTPNKRYKFTINDSEWKDFDGDSVWLKQMVKKLLSEWGAFLETNLFYDTVKHFNGGESYVVKRIEIMNGSRILGTQRTHLLNPETAFKISAITKDVPFYEQHLENFINHTALKAIQWINFNHEKIVFKTICK